MHSRVGCNQAPRPGNVADGSTTDSPFRTTILTKEDVPARCRQPRQVLTGSSLAPSPGMAKSCGHSRISLTDTAVRPFLYPSRSLFSEARCPQHPPRSPSLSAAQTFSSQIEGVCKRMPACRCLETAWRRQSPSFRMLSDARGRWDWRGGWLHPPTLETVTGTVTL